MDLAPQLSTRGRDTAAETGAGSDGASSDGVSSDGVASDGGDEPRFAVEEIIGIAVLLVVLGVVLSALHPSLLVRNTTPNGGDMGAHVWWPAFLRDHWFNHFRLAGWAPDWYAGFPVGQFYFPLPALLIDALAIVMPYNVAFKMVTVSGSLLLPISAYVFARALRFPWPSPPLFALAMLRYLFETRTGALTKGQDAWTIYGGNLASTLAGEFSYVLGIAFCLFFLAALAHALDPRTPAHRRRLWLPAVLLAATVLCHIVIAALAAVGGVAVWLTRKPLRTWKPALAIGAVGALLTAVWSVPLVVDTPYTQSMRYEKVTTFAIHLFGFRADQHHPLMPRPPWMWALIVVAVLAAGWWRRSSTLVLIVLATTFALFFRFWPEHSVWNTRYLPLYYLSIGLLAAVGVAELLRIVEWIARWSYDWIREGDRLDDLRNTRLAQHQQQHDAPGDSLAISGPAWVDSERLDAEPVDAEIVENGATAVPALPATALPETALPETWSNVALSTELADPPPLYDDEEYDHDHKDHVWRRRIAGAVTLVLALTVVTVPTVWWIIDHEGVAPDWATWNYEGYQNKTPPGVTNPALKNASWKEFDSIMTTMGKLPPGRALWEPSGDINNYGTTLALELLPYFTHGRIDSMEGLYFESSATTDFHFMTVAELTAPGAASNPVRGLVYGSIDDFDKGVEHLQMLGVRYFMAESPEAKAKADSNPNLVHVASVRDIDTVAPHGWKIYEVKGWNLAQGLQYEPVVVSTHGGPSSKCFDTTPPPKGTRDPELAAWECSAAPWWNSGDLDRPFAASGPSTWARASSVAAAQKLTPRPLPKVTVGPVNEGVDAISFHVSRVGVPVVVKTSYFPNWKAHGARGPWRLAPNLMVVIPTSKDVRLTYGETTGDRAGRVLTLAGVLGIVGLVRMRPSPEPVVAKPADPGTDGDGDGSELPLEPGTEPDDEGVDDVVSDEPAEVVSDEPEEVPALP
jgi:hypothetical protein